MDNTSISDKLFPESDAISLLSDDHERVRRLIGEFERARENGDAQVCAQLADLVCDELEIHAIIEEEIFYPAAREGIDHVELLDQAQTEHLSARFMIQRIRELDHGDPMWTAAVAVLGQQVRQHVDEEEREIFWLVKKSGIDLVALGHRMRDRRTALANERGLAHPDAAKAVAV